MWLRFSRDSVSVLLISFSLGYNFFEIPRVFAQEISAENEVGLGEREIWESPKYAIDLLQTLQKKDSNTLIDAGQLNCLIDKDGGGACASSAGIILLQTLRVLSGYTAISNPHKVVLSSFANQKELLEGRVSDRQFINLIDFYQSYLPGKSVEVKIIKSSTYIDQEDAELASPWDASTGPDFSVTPGQIKVVAFRVSEQDGKYVGRHFVLLKELKGSQITVLDPNNPTKDYLYDIVTEVSNDSTGNDFFLQRPGPQSAAARIFELETVYEITLSAKPKEGKDGLLPLSLEAVKAGIDEIALDLSGTEAYLSPRAWRKAGAEFGLPGLDLPEEVGGSNWSVKDTMEIFRHAGRHNLNFRDVVGGAHVRPLLHSSNPEILEIVKQVAKGEGYIAIAITEPEAGTDVRGMSSTSKKVEGGYLISGHKLYNARLGQASHVVVFTQSISNKPGELTVFVLPIDTPGIEIETLKAHGLEGNSFGGLRFENVFVPDSHRIGEDGQGSKIFFKHFLYWRLMQSAAAIGTGEGALEQMAQRLKTRIVFGSPLARFSHLQQALGKSSTELRMALALAREAAELLDLGDYGAALPIICGLKAEGVEMALEAADQAMRAYGGMGYSDLTDVGARVQDLQGLRIADGTTDVMRMEVVRRVFGEEFWRMGVLGKFDSTEETQ